jgi:hypothetical protein
MTIQDLIGELKQYDPNTQVILFATDSMDHGQEHVVIEQVRMVNEGIYSGHRAVYITDGS